MQVVAMKHGKGELSMFIGWPRSLANHRRTLVTIRGRYGADGVLLSKPTLNGAWPLETWAEASGATMDVSGK